MGKGSGRQRAEQLGRQQQAAQQEPVSHAGGAPTPATPDLSLGAAPSPAAHAVQLSRLGPGGVRQSAGRLQRAYGNRYVGQVATQAAPLVVQPKLTVTPPGDQYEEEADRVAGQVMRQIQGGAVQHAPEDEEAPVMRKGVDAATGGVAVSPGVESAIESARGGGQPLPEGTRAAMEGAIGADFSGVRVHADGQAHALNEDLSARAFTTGQDIFFRQGEYAPGRAEGQRLLAHELAHVVQQEGQNHALQQRIPIQRTYNKRDQNDNSCDDIALYLSGIVEEARDFIVKNPLNPTLLKIDGYTRRWGDVVENYFLTKSTDWLYTSFGYAIESYASNIMKGKTFDNNRLLVLQAKRGGTRPDFVVRQNNRDLAWLDITSTASKDHINKKAGMGWVTTQYVAEIFYKQLDPQELVTAGGSNMSDKEMREYQNALVRRSILDGFYNKVTSQFKEQARELPSKFERAKAPNSKKKRGSQSTRGPISIDFVNDFFNVHVIPSVAAGIFQVCGLAKSTYGFKSINANTEAARQVIETYVYENAESSINELYNAQAISVNAELNPPSKRLGGTLFNDPNFFTLRSNEDVKNIETNNFYADRALFDDELDEGEYIATPFLEDFSTRENINMLNTYEEDLDAETTSITYFSDQEVELDNLRSNSHLSDEKRADESPEVERKKRKKTLWN